MNKKYNINILTFATLLLISLLSVGANALGHVTPEDMAQLEALSRRLEPATVAGAPERPESKEPKATDSRLDHDRLTRLWENRHYKLGRAKGTCCFGGSEACVDASAAGTPVDILTTGGCAEFFRSETSGICDDCLGLELMAPYVVKGNTHDHKLVDGTVHTCRIMAEEIYAYLLQHGSASHGALMTELKDKTKTWNALKTAPVALCQTCKGYKKEHQARADIQGVSIDSEGLPRWLSLCAACGYASFLEDRNHCSIMHCSHCCSENLIDVATCVVCHQTTVGDTRVREGTRPGTDGLAHPHGMECASVMKSGNPKDHPLPMCTCP